MMGGKSTGNYFCACMNSVYQATLSWATELTLFIRNIFIYKFVYTCIIPDQESQCIVEAFTIPDEKVNQIIYHSW